MTETPATPPAFEPCTKTLDAVAERLRMAAHRNLDQAMREHEFAAERAALMTRARALEYAAVEFENIAAAVKKRQAAERRRQAEQQEAAAAAAMAAERLAAGDPPSTPVLPMNGESMTPVVVANAVPWKRMRSAVVLGTDDRGDARIWASDATWSELSFLSYRLMHHILEQRAPT